MQISEKELLFQTLHVTTKLMLYKRIVLTSTSTLCYSHSSGTAATALASTHDLYLQEV